MLDPVAKPARFLVDEEHVSRLHLHLPRVIDVVLSHCVLYLTSIANTRHEMLNKLALLLFVVSSRLNWLNILTEAILLVKVEPHLPVSALMVLSLLVDRAFNLERNSLYLIRQLFKSHRKRVAVSLRYVNSLGLLAQGFFSIKVTL